MALDKSIDTKRVPDTTDLMSPGSGITTTQPRPLFSTPIIMERSDKKGGGKKRKRYTKGTKALQRLFFGFSKAGYRAVNSGAEGLNTFVDRSKRSSEKKKDGIVRDVFRNASRGLSDDFNELGKAPDEIARRIPSRRVWKVVRNFTPFGG